MRHFIRALCGTLALSMATLFLPASAARAEDAPKPMLTQVGFAAGKSIDALAAFAKMIGIDLPPSASADGIEGQFPFVGKGGLATDQPIGVAIVGGPDTKDPTNAFVVVLPVKPAAATLDLLKAQGAKPVADRADTVLLNGIELRRTADYLLFSPTPGAVAIVNIGAIGDSVKGGDALVRVSLDVKAARENMPDQWKQLHGMIGGLAGGDPDKLEAMAPMMRSIDTANRLNMALDNGDKGLRLAFTTSPTTLPPVTAANRPGMPPGILGRVDVGITMAEASFGLKDRTAGLIKSAQDPKNNNGKPLSDAQKQQVADLITGAVALYLDPTAMSVGVEMIGGDPVIYVVQHRSKPTDVPAELQKLVNQFNVLMKTLDPTTSFDLITYQSDGVRVLRLVGMDNGKPQMYVDIVQKGDDVYATICPNQYRYIHKLLAAKDEGPISKVASAWLDLGKLAVALTGPGGDMAGMPPEKEKELLELLKDQKISMASSVGGDAGTVEFTVDKTLLQNMPKVLAIFGMGNGPASPSAAVVTANNAKQLLIGCLGYAADNGGKFPETLEDTAKYLGSPEILAKMQTTPRGSTFAYTKPADLNKNPDKIIILVETFPAGIATPAKIAVGYADGHVEMVDPASVKK
ncbi:MAG TPA: hypothetical protein VFE47_19455 [Tepidisphaeraceae bacterium]|jgi:hypothetical protein|nr:hypothetical protein [Tepidisphaeraceae bacterium]